MNVKFPLTVKDAQRLYARLNPWHPAHQLRGAICRAVGEPEESDFLYSPTPTVLAALARYASKHGANAILLSSPEGKSPESSARKHQIGADEIAVQSEDPDEDSLVHGGDSSSGEVESGTSGGGESNGLGEFSTGAHTPQEGSVQGDSATAGQLAGETGDTSPETDNSFYTEANGIADVPADGTLVTESAPATEQGSSADNTMRATAESSDALSMVLTNRANDDMSDACPVAPGKEIGDADEPTASENKCHYRKLPRGNGHGSLTARREFGGITAELKRANASMYTVNAVRRALASLLDGGETQAGPRWDWTAFCVRLQTARPVYAARREEEGRPAILVLADVSGSCSGFSEYSVIVAKAVAKIGVSGADAIVVTHSNGFPQELQINDGNPAEIADYMSEDEAREWYDRLLQRYDLRLVITLGDWDAEWLYRRLASQSRVARLVWLDNWSCNYIAPRAEPTYLAKYASVWNSCARAKTTYVVGCKDVNSFVAGLQLAMKGSGLHRVSAGHASVTWPR